MAALDEALEYLIQNTFNKMGYLEAPDCRTAQGNPGRPAEQRHRQGDAALPDGREQPAGHRGRAELRRALLAKASQQIVLHDMIEKRYALRPYGWPDDEVLLLVARLLVLGEISLMMDGALLPLDKVYEAITTPAKRRKIIVVKRQTDRPQGDPERPQSRQGAVRRDGAGRRGRPVRLPAEQAEGLADHR